MLALINLLPSSLSVVDCRATVRRRGSRQAAEGESTLQPRAVSVVQTMPATWQEFADACRMLDAG